MVFALHLAGSDGGNDHRLACLHQRLHKPRLRVISLVGNDSLRIDILEKYIRALKNRCLPLRQLQADGIAQRIHGGVYLRANTPRLRQIACASPPLCRRHYVGGLERWAHRSSRTRCPRLVPMPGTHAATRRYGSSVCDAGARRGSRQSAWVVHAGGYLRDRGRAQPQRTVGCL